MGCISHTSSSDIYSGITVSYNNMNSADAWISDSYYDLYATTTLKPSSYTQYTYLNYDSLGGYMSYSDETICDYQLNLTVLAADSLLLNYGLSISDLGFTSYS